MKNRLENLTLAVDLDDTVCHTAARTVQVSNREWGMQITLEDITENWIELFGPDLAEVDRRAAFLQTDEITMSMEPIEGALEVLDRWKSRGVNILGTTSRVRRVRQPTLAWLNKHYKGIFTEVYHAGIYDGPEQPDMHLRTKADLYRHLKIDCAIDDQPKHVLAAKSLGAGAILLGDYPWNRNFDHATENIVRAKDWLEADGYFEERFARVAA